MTSIGNKENKERKKPRLPPSGETERRSKDAVPTFNEFVPAATSRLSHSTMNLAMAAPHPLIAASECPLPAPPRRAKGPTRATQPRSSIRSASVKTKGSDDLTALTDEELVERGLDEGENSPALDDLYERFYPRVAQWCLRLCSNRDQALDLAQEVFLRVHQRLHTFRFESRFSTWLYTLTRRTVINRLSAEKIRAADPLDDPSLVEQRDEGKSPEDEAVAADEGARLRRDMQLALKPLEAQVLYLHYVLDLTLPAITRLLELDNKSGAKAFVVNGQRKLRKQRQDAARAVTTDGKP